MTKRELKFDKDGNWICPHGFVTGFFSVPGAPHLIEHRSCGICCEEISEHLARVDGEETRRIEK
jgi:hypothetical protein